METNETQLQLLQLQARVLALMSVVATMVKNHPDRAQLNTSAEALAQLHECALLSLPHPDEAAHTMRKTIEQVRLLATLELVPGAAP